MARDNALLSAERNVEFDDEPEFEPGIDGCHHGVGFDEDCEDCDWEMEDDE